MAVLVFMNYLLLPAQSNRQNRFTVSVSCGITPHFGQFNPQAELTGGTDTLFFDTLRHYIPGFKSSYPIVINFGYQSQSRFTADLHIDYHIIDVGLIKTFGNEEFNL